MPSPTEPRSETPVIHGRGDDRQHASPRVYTVWAPRGQSLELVLGDRRLPMHQGVNGWWQSDVPIALETPYGFVVNGDGPFPDPRSPYQPNGVDGLSQQIDHAAFRWTDEQWQAPPLASAVIYELHIGTFTPGGTFDSAIERLSHLVDLGITHVEVMPVAQFSGNRGWGYDGVDLFAPHTAYGGPEGFKRFVDACHASRLAVILDVVYNHLGPLGNYLSRFGPYFTDRYRTPWGEAVNLDGPGSDEVRRFFCENALMWLRDYHIDGLRIDAVQMFFDSSATHIVEQLTSEVKALEAALGRRLVVIAESDLNDPRVTQPRECGGWGADAQWSDDVHHALHALLTGERSGYYNDFGTMQHLATALGEVFVYAGRASAYRGRVHGRAVGRADGWRFVVASQNHDQIGNRAKGDRLSALVSPGCLKIASALLLTSPFVPLLFQGEEWAASTPFTYFTAHENQHLGEQVRKGRHDEFAAFGWDPHDIPDPQSPDTFRRARLRWDELVQPSHAAMLEWYRRLIALRRQTPALRDGDYRACGVRFNEGAGWIVVNRKGIATVCNLSTRALDVPLGAAARVMLASDAGIEISGNAVRMVPEGAAIVSIDSSATARPGF